MRLVYGFGFNDRTKTSRSKEYKLWNGMLERCYSERLHLVRPTYLGCEASENFKKYSYFHDWCQNQIGFGAHGFELDKDTLLKGNKTYSEDLCVFIPKEINSMMTKTDAARGENPIGVCFKKRVGMYHAQHTKNNRSEHIGYFNNPNDAFLAYKSARESYIKEVANKYKDQIDPRAYVALMNYTIDIND